MITYAELVGVNIAVCLDAGEQSAVINENNLLSALSVQQWYNDDRLLASALIRSITIGHGFQDGNKRTAAIIWTLPSLKRTGKKAKFNINGKIVEHSIYLNSEGEEVIKHEGKVYRASTGQ